MTYEEAITKILWDSECDRFCDRCSYENCELGIAKALVIEALEEQSEIVHCKDCKYWKIITIETIYGRTAKVGQCELTKWLCGEQGYCMYGKEVEDEID